MELSDDVIKLLFVGSVNFYLLSPGTVVTGSTTYKPHQVNGRERNLLGGENFVIPPGLEMASLVELTHLPNLTHKTR